MKTLIVLVGPPGSGKSTLAKSLTTHTRISQDDAGKEAHMRQFLQAIAEGDDIVVDRLNFNKEQRERYLAPARANNYKTKIIVLHQPQAVCLERMLKREGHPTIQDEKSARGALHTFFCKYERPQPGEADEIEFQYPEGDKPYCIPVDLDGSLCNVDHRLHHVRKEGKKDWVSFMREIPNDSVNKWCEEIIKAFRYGNQCGAQIIYCSGRSRDNYYQTKQWLLDNRLYWDCTADSDSKGMHSIEHLYMRPSGDHRQDFIIKEVLLDFEVLTRFTPLFMIDDRLQVTEMYRKRGFTVLQCAKGDF